MEKKIFVIINRETREKVLVPRSDHLYSVPAEFSDRTEAEKFLWKLKLKSTGTVYEIQSLIVKRGKSNELHRTRVVTN